MWRFLSSGLNYSIPGNGGPECLSYTSHLQRFLETFLVSALCYAHLYWFWPKLNFPTCDRLRHSSERVMHEFTAVRRFLVAFLCTIFGAQIGYKVASESVIFLLNPCHIVTIMQICLLLCDPWGRWVTLMFRVHHYLLSGATLALVFPVLNSLMLPFEIHLYYIQHCTILLIPLYLLSYGGSFSLEEFFDPHWAIVVSCLVFLYHFIFLNVVSIATLANLNNLLCPAVSDPFRGQFYRLWAIGHQSLYIPLHGKLYAALANLILLLTGVKTSADYADHVTLLDDNSQDDNQKNGKIIVGRKVDRWSSDDSSSAASSSILNEQFLKMNNNQTNDAHNFSNGTVLTNRRAKNAFQH